MMYIHLDTVSLAQNIIGGPVVRSWGSLLRRDHFCGRTGRPESQPVSDETLALIKGQLKRRDKLTSITRF